MPVHNNVKYEGSIIMKKYVAALTAFLAAAGSVSPISSQAENFEPEVSPLASSTKKFIEELNVDTDINSDGKFDIFDVYAFYRCEVGSVDSVPDSIIEKYEAIPKKRTDDKIRNTVMDETETEELSFFLDFDHLAEYFFTFYGLKPEYFDPNFYLDNCPDTYDDPLSADVIKEAVKDIDRWDIFNFTKTTWYVKNEDGSYRPFNETDLDNAYIYDEGNDSYAVDNNFFYYNAYASPIHEFIRDFKIYTLSDISTNHAFMDTLIRSDGIDTDINSDGVYDYDDIVLIAHYLHTYIYAENNDRDIFRYVWTHQQSSDYSENYPAELREASYCPISEDEWNKADEFVGTVRFYFYDDFSLLRFLTENYLLENDVDQKYFDAAYYEKNHFAHYEYDKNFFHATGNDEGFFNYLGFLKTFSFRYGLESDKNSDLVEKAGKHEIFTEDEVNAAFPEYYKKVKTGAIAEPDMDLDGKTGISDYIILDDIDDEYISICGYSSDDVFLLNYPEVRAEINISQEARDNYKNTFDFNNNGISCDFLETECMRMYILGELESQYENTDALSDAICQYKQEHPEIVYNRIDTGKMEKFISDNAVGFTAKEEMSSDPESVYEAVEIIKNYSSYNQIFNVPETADGMKGDVNGDGNVDISDAVLIMQYISNPSKYGVNGSDEKHITKEGYFRADVDGEGVTNMDALAIQKYLLGLSSIS